MSTWSYNQILTATGGSWAVEPGHDEFDFAGAAIDSRELKANQIFFAFVGEHADGHAYLAQAADGDAALCVITDDSKLPNCFAVPTLLVDDALDALTEIARAWREKLSCTVIAITGSNGKTTTCRLMHSICQQAGKSFVSQKSFNNALGVPITILNTPRDADYLIAEVGASTPGEIAQRAALVRPDLAIITSIGRAHLEALGSVAGVAKEKASLIESLPDGGRAFVPANIEHLDAAIAELRPLRHITRLGRDHPIKIIEPTAAGTRFSVDADDFVVPLPGLHNASNAALCVLAARTLHLTDEQVRSGLANAKGPAMRFERVEIPTETDPIVIINDAYNANPDSMRAALATFNAMKTATPPTTHKTAVLGEMLELGEASETEHRALADELANHTGIDRFVLVGAGFESVPMSHMVEVHADKSDFSIERVAGGIAPGACVLLKGSRGVRLERLIDALTRLHAPDLAENHTSA